MNELLFSLNNVNVQSAIGSVDVDDTDYSCMWQMVRDQDGYRGVIDLKSIKRREWIAGKASWVSDCVPMTVIVGLQDRLQQQIDHDQIEDEENLRETA